MNLYEQKIEFNLRDMLDNFLDFSSMRFKQCMQKGTMHPEIYTVGFSYGRAAGHTTAVLDHVIETDHSKPSTFTLLILPNRQMMKHAQDKIGYSGNVAYVCDVDDTFRIKIKELLIGRRYKNIEIIGDSVDPRDVYNVCNAVVDSCVLDPNGGTLASVCLGS